MLSRVVLINDRSVARGGATALAVAAARLLCAAGVPVTFITGDAGDGAELVATGAEIVPIGGKHILQTGKAAAFRDGLYFAESRRVLQNWISKNDAPGVVYHVHSWSKILSPSIFAALANVARRCVIHAHDFFMACPNGGFMNYRTDEVCELVAMSPRCLATNCDKRNYAEKIWRVSRQAVRARYFNLATSGTDYLLVHQGMARLFRKSGVPDAHLHVLPNPVQFSATARVVAEANRDVCMIGRLDPEKGALDAAAAAREAGVTLRIVGDGVQRAEIEAKFPEVEILGWSSAEEVRMALASARVLVVPSRWRETFGLVVAEALSLGVPVIVSDKALIAPDVVRHGAGLSLDTRDIAVFAGALRQIAGSDAMVRGMSERAMGAAADLATTEARWRDALLARYAALAAR
jgi:glycosyltransferase involved in cell wall biosynthesis